MKKFNCRVTVFVDVDLKEVAFTEQFMEEFRLGFYPFDTLEEHAAHVAQLVAREVIDPIWSDYGQEQFVEGYGRIGDFFSRVEIDDFETEAEPTP